MSACFLKRNVTYVWWNTHIYAQTVDKARYPQRLSSSGIYRKLLTRKRRNNLRWKIYVLYIRTSSKVTVPLRARYLQRYQEQLCCFFFTILHASTGPWKFQVVKVNVGQTYIEPIYVRIPMPITGWIAFRIIVYISNFGTGKFQQFQGLWPDWTSRDFLFFINFLYQDVIKLTVYRKFLGLVYVVRFRLWIISFFRASKQWWEKRHKAREDKWIRTRAYELGFSKSRRTRNTNEKSKIFYFSVTKS